MLSFIRSRGVFLFLLSAVFASASFCSRAEGMLSDAEKAQIADVVRGALKDPESAHFKWDLTTLDVSSVNGFGEVCLKVSAKNVYGGYVGYQFAWITFKKKSDRLENISIERMGDKAAVESCDSIRENIKAITHHDANLSEDQARAGCSWVNGKLFCESPGTGMCWAKGHDPLKGESPARSIDVGNDQSSPDAGHSEGCSSK